MQENVFFTFPQNTDIRIYFTIVQNIKKINFKNIMIKIYYHSIIPKNNSLIGILFENKVFMSGHDEGKYKELKIIYKNEYS